MNNVSSKSIISELLQHIQKGSADSVNQNQFFELNKQEEVDLKQLDIEHVKLASPDLTKNIDELFSFIKKNNLAQTMQIVDSEGLVIAENGDNSIIESLTVSFPQYLQMLEYAEFNSHSSGFWIQIKDDYILSIVEEINELSYGLIMQCNELLPNKHTMKIKNLLKTVIKKGVNYE